MGRSLGRSADPASLSRKGIPMDLNAPFPPPTEASFTLGCVCVMSSDVVGLNTFPAICFCTPNHLPTPLKLLFPPWDS